MVHRSGALKTLIAVSALLAAPVLSAGCSNTCGAVAPACPPALRVAPIPVAPCPAPALCVAPAPKVNVAAPACPPAVAVSAPEVKVAKPQFRKQKDEVQEAKVDAPLAKAATPAVSLDTLPKNAPAPKSTEPTTIPLPVTVLPAIVAKPITVAADDAGQTVIIPLEAQTPDVGSVRVLGPSTMEITAQEIDNYSKTDVYGVPEE